MPTSRRFFAIAACVTLLHAAALWALQLGLSRGPAPAVAVTLLADLGPRPAPPASPEPGQPETGPPPTRRPAPAPALSADAAPPAAAALPATPTGRTEPAALAGSGPVTLGPAVSLGPPAAAPAAAAGGLPAGPGTASRGSTAARIDLPSGDDSGLQNPRPAYPPISRRLGEQGRVVVRVLVSADGLAQQAQVHQSSGHDRLDQSALATVQRWRFVPGRRDGAPEAMWFSVPVNFRLE